MGKLKVNKTTDLSGYGKEGVRELGKIAVESMEKSGKWAKVMEKAGVSKEALAKETINVTETDLFETAIAGFIEKKLRPQLVAENVIKTINNFDTKGQNAIKVPLRSALISASDLPDDGDVSYDSGSYGSTTITLAYIYAANKLTHEITKFANVDLIAEELGEIGSAIGRKVDSDIISAMQTATTTPNGNLTQLGSGTYVDYDALVDGINSAKENYAQTDTLLISPETEARIMKLDEFSGGSNLVGASAFKGGDTEYFPYAKTILNHRVVTSNQVDDDDIYLVDTERNGYLIKAGSVETFDSRVSGALAYEIIGALNVGVGIVQPKAIYRIEEDA